MAAGHRINTTEDRAVMHVALRAPKEKQLFVDGEDVVPGVHAVLEKVLHSQSHNQYDKLLILLYKHYS